MSRVEEKLPQLPEALEVTHSSKGAGMSLQNELVINISEASSLTQSVYTHGCSTARYLCIYRYLLNPKENLSKAISSALMQWYKDIFQIQVYYSVLKSLLQKG